MLISEHYRRMNADLHNRAVFGQRGARHVPVVREILREYGADCTVLDYGCGRADLERALPDVKVWSYDPAIKHRATLPPPCDIVVCTDVLEHIEPDYLDDVLAHIKILTRKAAHLVVCTKLDGNKKLADGRDPHLIVQPAEWWRERICQHMPARLINCTERDVTFRVTVAA